MTILKSERKGVGHNVGEVLGASLVAKLSVIPQGQLVLVRLVVLNYSLVKRSLV